MERILIKDLKKHVGKTVSLAGWIDVRRDHGKLIFLDVRDATGVVQTVATPKTPSVFETAEKLRSEWVVQIAGEVKKRPESMVNPDLPTGDIEVSITELSVLSEAAEMPFDRDEKQNLDTYLDHLPLSLRTDRARTIFKIQTEIIQAFRRFLIDENFVEFQAPRLIGEDAEGGAATFEVPYFEHTAHLAQSPQFYKQIMVGVFERVFTTGNVFRAEKHSTSRHLNEYTSLDIEMGFIEDHHTVMKITTRLMRSIVADVEERCAKELAALRVPPIGVPEEIPFMKLREAQRLIKEKTGEDCESEPDLTPAHERWLSEYTRETHNSDFLFVTHFPSDKKPLYVYDDPDDPGYTKYFDLLFRGIEAASGGQRIHDYNTLVEKLRGKGLDPKKFSFYLQAFKYGMPPHGGFGMGLERLTAKFCGLNNVKEATLFPREINRIDTLLSEDEGEAEAP